MKIAITAYCAFCARRFNALIGQEIFCDDNDGRLCCNECLCAYCGHGHVTDAERDECDQFGVDNYGQDVDPDAFRDSVYDVHAGVI